MYFNLMESVSMRENYNGLIFEDVVGLTLRRIFFDKPETSITSDNAAGGADFIVRYGKTMFVIEVGYRVKGNHQVAQTMNRFDAASYGIVISQTPLSVDEQKNIVSVPISYVLPM